MKLRDKDDTVLYDRTPHVLDNNGILTNWEDVIVGQIETGSQSVTAEGEEALSPAYRD